MAMGDSSSDTFLERLREKLEVPGTGGIGIIDDPGRIAPGTTSPSSRFHIATGTPAAKVLEKFYGGSGTVFAGPFISEAAHVYPRVIKELAIGDDGEIDPDDFGIGIGVLLSDHRDLFGLNGAVAMSGYLTIRDPIVKRAVDWSEVLDRHG